MITNAIKDRMFRGGIKEYLMKDRFHPPKTYINSKGGDLSVHMIMTRLDAILMEND
jgi:hypothetical protein